MKFQLHRLVRYALVFVFLFSFLGCCEVSFGQDQDQKQDQSATRVPEGRRGAPETNDRHPVKVPGLTARQQGEIKRFVRENHPEIMRLVMRLQDRHPKAYVNAMKSIAASYRRLNNIQQNSPERYDAALKRWNVRSRIKLLSARIAIKDTPQRRQELKELVAEGIELRVAQLQEEQARMTERMEKVERRLSKLTPETESEMEALITREMKMAIRRSQKLLPGQKGNNSKSQRQQKNKKKQKHNESESGDGAQ